MKVIGLVAVVLCLVTILGSGPGVPTQGSSTGYTPTAATIADPVTATSTSANTAMNPRHGEPGHRCDIPVGAPLNSKPSLPASKFNAPTASGLPTNPATNFTIPATTILPTTPVNGLNPKHGQPGHRCDIPVGQPLNSKPTLPVTPAANPTTTSSPATANLSGVPPRLNPKHGQPFHRCDILVGQPLDSKPTLPVAPAANPTTTSSPVPATSPAVRPRLNPKHGQPFHRCDILVGQPLDSKPTIPGK
jgi:hypothetical protein